MEVLKFITLIIMVIIVTIILVTLHIKSRKSRQLNKWLNNNAKDKFNSITFMQRSLDKTDLYSVHYIMAAPVIVTTIDIVGHICINKKERTIKFYDEVAIYKNPTRLHTLLGRVLDAIEPDCVVALQVSNINASKYKLDAYLDAVNFVFSGRSVLLFN